MSNSEFSPHKVLDALMADVLSQGSGRETDKVLADALVRGAGYMRFTADGVEHVPFDSVRVAPQPAGDE